MSELYELPDGWEWKKLKDIANFQNGFAFKSKEFNTDGYGLQVIRIGNVLDINKNPVYIDERKEFEKYLLKMNDIVISMTGTRNKKDYLFLRVIKTNNSYLNQRVGKITNNEKSMYKYLYYFLKSNNFRNKIFGYETGTVNQGNISFKDIMNSDIPTPILQEQKRIVSKLDTLFEKIDKSIAFHQKNMDEADAFMGSVLNDVFKGLEEKYQFYKIFDKFNLKTGGTPSTKNKDYWNDGTIKWLSSSDINQIEIYDCKGRITELGFNNSNAKIIEKDSVLIALNGQGKTRGSVAMLRTEATLNQSLVAMIPKNRDENMSDFLFRNLQMRYIEIRKMTGLNERRGLNMKFIGNIELPLPSLSIQQKVVSYLDEISQKIEKIKSVQKEKMQSLVALKSSILDQAFRGDIPEL